jgi:enoyl-CoA hydratase/carnithine racemase
MMQCIDRVKLPQLHLLSAQLFAMCDTSAFSTFAQILTAFRMPVIVHCHGDVSRLATLLLCVANVVIAAADCIFRPPYFAVTTNFEQMGKALGRRLTPSAIISLMMRKEPLSAQDAQ